MLHFALALICGGHDVASCHNAPPPVSALIYAHNKYRYMHTGIYICMSATALVSMRKRRIATSCASGQLATVQQFVDNNRGGECVHFCCCFFF